MRIYDTDGPEIITMTQEAVWHIEVAILAKVGTPGVADNKHLLVLDVANCQKRMAVFTMPLIVGRR
jgi:hypothetical protein